MTTVLDDYCKLATNYPLRRLNDIENQQYWSLRYLEDQPKKTRFITDYAKEIYEEKWNTYRGLQAWKALWDYVDFDTYAFPIGPKWKRNRSKSMPSPKKSQEIVPAPYENIPTKLFWDTFFPAELEDFVSSDDEEELNGPYFSTTIDGVTQVRPFTPTIPFINGIRANELYPDLGMWYDHYPVKSLDAVGLVGGGKPRPKKRRKGGTKKRRGPSMIYGKQLGQINSFVPYDKPIVTTLRYNGTLVTDGSGVLSARFSLRNPKRAFNGSGSYVNADDFGSLYDQYKVMYFSFQGEPTPTGPIRGSLVIAFDYDSPDTATPNYANIVNYGGYRIFNAGLQLEAGTRVPNITSGFDFTTDPPSAIIVHQGGWIDAATPAAPGNMFIGGIGLGNSVTVMQFVLTMKIAWRFRR